MFTIWIFLFTMVWLFVAHMIMAENIPCSIMKGEGGFVCVCNVSYCDTIERPIKLPRGQYLHYSTSEATPGFNLSNGTFSDTVTSNNISNNVFIYINSSVQYQTFYGFGGGISDSVGINFNSLPPEAQDKFIESFFGISGLEYTFARVPIAGSDFSLRIYTYDDVPGDNDLQHFNLTEEDFTLKIPLIRRAMQASERGLKIIASSWTAPSWMKTDDAPRQGYLLSKYHYTFALYFYKFLKAYKDLGIDIWGICPGNELVLPLFFGSFFGMPNTVMLPHQSRYWTKNYFGPMIKNSEFKNVKIITLDDERPFLAWWSTRMFSDKDCAKYIDGVALHWYLDTNSTLQSLCDFHNKYPDKLLLYTESSINSGLNSHRNLDVSPFELGDWSRAVRYLNNMFPNLNHWVSSYLDWNIALDTDGGPSSNSTGVKLDSSVVVNTTNGEFYKQPIYYVLGHFSKFIPPGAKKIKVTIQQETVDFYDEENSIDTLLHRFKTVDDTRKTLPPPDPTGAVVPDPLPTGAPGPAPTGFPFPTRAPEPPSNTVQVLATSNPDGSVSVISYNPRPEPANLIVQDSIVGSFNKTVEAHSLNTFVYWL